MGSKRSVDRGRSRDVWGRECPNLGSRGFVALSTMPSLRALGVSCKNVDDEALATLPDFPRCGSSRRSTSRTTASATSARCARLERLTCMYCRETTDAATEHIAGLRIKYYYAGLTQITDRSLRSSAAWHRSNRSSCTNATASLTPAAVPRGAAESSRGSSGWASWRDVRGHASISRARAREIFDVI